MEGLKPIFINPYTDFGFKKLFGEEGNKDLLIDFLNELLPPKHQIASLEFKNVEMLPGLGEERKAFFDIHCKATSGECRPMQRDAYEQSIMDYIGVREVAVTAKEEGREEARAELVIEMYKEGIPILQISKITKLTIQIVQGIIEECERKNKVVK